MPSIQELSIRVSINEAGFRLSDGRSRNWGGEFNVTPQTVQKESITKIIDDTQNIISFDINLPHPGLILIGCIGAVDPGNTLTSEIEYGFSSVTDYPLIMGVGEFFIMRASQKQQPIIYMRSRTPDDNPGAPMYVQFVSFDRHTSRSR